MINVRLKAYEIFRAIVRDGGYSNLVLASKLSSDIYVTDRGFITALVYGTIDKIYNLDYIISLFAKGRLQPKIQDVLRISVYQLMYMQVAQYTVCDEAVKLTAAIGKVALKGYVNGVMRNISRNMASIDYPDRVLEPVKYLCARYSWPEFLAADMLKHCSFDEAEARMSYVTEPAIAVRANTLMCSDDELLEQLVKKKLDPKPGLLYKNVYYIKGNKIFKDKLFENGFCSTQSEPSMLVCRVVNPQRGERILDCCAAPGGKAVYMAQLMGKGEIVACDSHKHRCDLIFANAQRCKVKNIVNPLCADSTVFSKELGLFDRVLIDAPCSGLGVVSAKPDIKITLTRERLAVIQHTQERILENCCNYVKSGGVLVYSTCTVRYEENCGQIDAFVRKHPEFIVENITAPEAVKSAETPQGYIQLVPHIHKTEGFFIAKLKKR